MVQILKKDLIEMLNSIEDKKKCGIYSSVENYIDLYNFSIYIHSTDEYERIKISVDSTIDSNDLMNLCYKVQKLLKNHVKYGKNFKFPCCELILKITTF